MNPENFGNEEIKFKNELDQMEAKASTFVLFPEFAESFINREPKINFSHLLNEAGITKNELQMIIDAANKINDGDYALLDKEIEYTPKLNEIKERLRKVLVI